MLIEKVSKIINESANNLIHTYYENAKGIVNSINGIGLLDLTLILLACFWIYSKIGKEWSKEDFYKAGTWILMYSFIKVIFSDYTYYEGFLNVIRLPASWIYGAVGTNSNASVGVDTILQYSTHKATSIWEGIEFMKNPRLSLLLLILGMLLLLVIWIYVIFYAIFIIVINFISAILLAFCPVMLPALLIPNFRGYFFSWLKLYTSTVIQPVFAYAIGSIMGHAINTFGKDQDLKIEKNIFETNTDIFSTMIDFFIIVVLCIVAISALSKIPAWTQQIIGSGDGEHKTGLAGLANMGANAIGQGFKSFSKARNGINYNTGGKNSFARAAMSGLAGMIPGGAGLSQKIAGQTEGAKEAYRQGAFTATPTPHIDNSKK